MNGWVGAALVGWALVCPALAEPLQLQVRTRPTGALLRDQFGNELGRSHRAITIDWDRSRGPLTLEMLLDDHQKVSRTLSYAEIKNGIYPTDGEIVLPPDNAIVALKDGWNEHRLPVVLGMLALGAGALALRRKTRSATASGAPVGDLVIGGYRLLEKIGQGATAEVFRAVSDNDPGALPVALKLLRERESLDGQSEERFKNEVKASLNLRHPHLVEIYDWGEDAEGRLYMVTELLSGHSLRQCLQSQPRLSSDEQAGRAPLTQAEVSRITTACGSALTYLHEQGLVHRDVKPDNIFLTEGGGVKLMDLGLAKGGEIAPMTQAGVVLGTPHYMAPEQMKSEASPLSDQYALGVTAYEMLAGRRPFRGGDALELFRQNLNEPVPPLSRYRPDAPPVLEAVLERMLAKQPAQRFPSVLGAVESLSAALAAGDDQGLDTEAFQEMAD